MMPYTNRSYQPVTCQTAGCYSRNAKATQVSVHESGPLPDTFSIALTHGSYYDAVMDELARKWAEQGRYDLDTADAMFNAGRYLYVLFCCQQAVEKTIKALIVQRTNQLPPRIHQLARLAEVAGLVVDEGQMEFLRELSTYYIPTRYPEAVADLALDVKESKARRVLGQSREFIQWLSSIMQ
jgi:HEPN domain-containing protein